MDSDGANDKMICEQFDPDPQVKSTQLLQAAPRCWGYPRAATKITLATTTARLQGSTLSVLIRRSPKLISVYLARRFAAHF